METVPGIRKDTDWGFLSQKADRADAGNLAVQMDGDLFKVILSFEEYQEDKKQ